jgi:hypothetical protein
MLVVMTMTLCMDQSVCHEESVASWCMLRMHGPMRVPPHNQPPQPAFLAHEKKEKLKQVTGT